MSFLAFWYSEIPNKISFTAPFGDKLLGDSAIYICHNLKDIKLQEKCWEDLMKEAFQNKGVDGAFSLLETLYKNEPAFVDVCHNFAHEIGFRVYDDFIKTRKINLAINSATTACGYGFYHGFMTKLFGEGKDIKIAHEFCTYINNRLAKDSPGVSENCYHGIGHGAAVDPEKNLWGNAEAIIKQTAGVCRLVSDNIEEVAPCYDGAFMGVTDLYQKNKYGFAIKELKGNPYLLLCQGNFEERLGESCYRAMFPITLFLSNDDLIKAVKLIEAIPEDRHAQIAIRTVASRLAFTELKESDHTHLFLACRTLKERLKSSCLKGVIAGLVWQQLDFDEAIQDLSICTNTVFTPEEKRICYMTELENLNKVFSKEKVTQICQLIDPEYQKYCQ